MHIAVEQNASAAIIQLLIKYGAKRELVDRDECTPLDLAKEKNADNDIIALLSDPSSSSSYNVKMTTPRPSSSTAKSAEFSMIREVFSSLSLKEQYALAFMNKDAKKEEDGKDIVEAFSEENKNTLLAAVSSMNESEREELSNDALTIQKNVRSWILRSKYKEVKEAALKVQALAKGHLARRSFRELREKVSATLVIQKNLRKLIERKKSLKNNNKEKDKLAVEEIEEDPIEL